MKKFLIFGMLSVVLTGCYAMPGDCDYCVVPSTNNPDYTGGRGTASSAPSAMPQIPGGF